MMFFAGLVDTLAREWTGIDKCATAAAAGCTLKPVARLRMDKFMVLARKGFFEALVIC